MTGRLAQCSEPFAGPTPGIPVFKVWATFGFETISESDALIVLQAPLLNI